MIRFEVKIWDDEDCPKLVMIIEAVSETILTDYLNSKYEGTYEFTIEEIA